MSELFTTFSKTMSSNSAEKESKAKKPSDKEVDLSNCNRGVWLVKVPKYISERWEAGGGGKDVGKLQIIRKPNQKPIVSFKMDEKLAGPMPNAEFANKGAISKDHSFQVSTVSAQSLAVFSVTTSKTLLQSLAESCRK